MRDGEIVLSRRLQMLADMIPPGSRLVDVGCDHGFLSIYLVQTKGCSHALAMDVRKGPLEGARRHVEEFGLGEYIETRLSDGLKAYLVGEADTLVCAGMGGRLMEKILTESMDKARGLGQLILQPQSELAEFRAFLRQAGFVPAEEGAVLEDGKYYFAMKVLWCEGLLKERPEREQRLYDLFGEILLRQRNPVLLQYLRQKEEHLRQLAAVLNSVPSERAKIRLPQVRRELGEIESALEFF